MANDVQLRGGVTLFVEELSFSRKIQIADGSKLLVSE
jgi:hypothetical protein